MRKGRRTKGVKTREFLVKKMLNNSVRSEQRGVKEFQKSISLDVG